MRHRPTRREFAAGLVGLASGHLLLPQRSAAQARSPHRIDFHCHPVPPAWVAFLKSRGLGSPGNSWQLSKHLDDMEKAGVATSLLSLASPGIWHGRDLAAIRRVAREVNEFVAKLGADHPGRFGNFATLPLPDVEGSLPEVAYAFDVLKADGICMRTPYGNVWHGDPVFAPLYEELNRRNAVVFTHPQDADCCENLVPGIPSQSSIEYGTHTTRTIVSLLESGMAARYPNIRWVFAHAGGTMPFLLARIVGRKLPPGPDGMVTLDPTRYVAAGRRRAARAPAAVLLRSRAADQRRGARRAPPGRAHFADRVRHRLSGVGFGRNGVAASRSRRRARRRVQRR